MASRYSAREWTATYHYDNVGNRNVMIEGGGSARVTWSYDKQNQLNLLHAKQRCLIQWHLSRDDDELRAAGCPSDVVHLFASLSNGDVHAFLLLRQNEVHKGLSIITLASAVLVRLAVEAKLPLLRK